jgi:hypothetical protein
MTAELLASKIVVQEESPAVQTIQGVPTAVAMCVGITEKGPVGKATLITSHKDFMRIFGREISGGIAASAVAGFFKNGGRRMYFTRTVHYDNQGDPQAAQAEFDLNTAAAAPGAGTVLGSIVGPYNLNNGDTLIVDVDGGGPVTATFNATRASRSAANAAPYALSNNQTLLVKIDGGPVQTITFNTAEFVAIGAATAAEVAAVINAELGQGHADVSGGLPRINSDKLGTGSHVEVTGGTGNTALGFLTAVENGTGNVADIDEVTVAEVKAIVEAAIPGCTVTDDGGATRITSNTTGASSSVQVTAGSTADDELGLNNATHSGSGGEAAATLTIKGKYPGTYANDLTVLIANATSGAAAEFNLHVLNDGVVVESWPNLTMDDTAPRYVESVINNVSTGSTYIEVEDLALALSAANQRPANSSGTPPVAFGPLTGGDDGLAGLTETDFIGDALAKTGIRSFDLKNDGTILLIPDRPTAVVHGAMVEYCEITRANQVVALLDPPSGYDAEGIVDYVENTALLLNLSEQAVIYWPQIKIANPNKAVYGSSETLVVPPSGHIAGMWSRTDGARVGGVYDPPAGIVKGILLGAAGFETDEVLEESRRDIVYPKRINPITKHRGQPIAVDGARTLKSTGNFPFVSERRGVNYIVQSVQDGIQFARLRNNDDQLREQVDRTIVGFLLRQMNVGAFRSRIPSKAFQVEVSRALNPDSEIFAGKLNVRIGLATQKPAEFIVITISQDTRALEEEIAAAAG